MTKNKTTKRALLVSVLALLLCASLLVGSTFAWFTDNVTSTNNIIKSGNLDVKLEYSTDLSTWAEVGAKTDIFKNEDGTTDLWEPGFTEVVYLKVSNVGSLALKYALEVTVADEKQGTNQAGEKFSLSQYIKYDVVKYTAEEPYENRDAAVAAVPNAVALKTGIPAISNVSLEPKTENTIDSDVLALVVYMPTTVGNVANHNGEDIPTINLGITLNATQLAYEEDSFGPDYDEDAVYGTYVELNEGDDLLAAMASAEAGLPLTIKLNGDVEWPTEGHHNENDITPASSIVINGNGNTITATGSGVTPLGDAEAPMTLKNVKIVDNSKSYNESAWELSYLEMGGRVLNCVDVDFADPISVDSDKATFTGCTFVGHYDKNSTSTTQYGVWAYNGDSTYTNCTFTGTRGMKICDQYSGEVGTVVVDGCTFNGISEKPGICIDDRDAQDMKITIKNSTFINCKAGDQGLYIYETDNAVPTLENNNVYNNAKFVSTAAEFLALGGKSNEGVIILTADIDLNGAAVPTIGAAYGKELVVLGNGYTISNGTTAHTSHNGMKHHGLFYAYTNSTLTISDLVIDNVDIDATADTTRNYGAGVVVAYADDGSNVTLKNVDVKNCDVKNNTPDIGDEAAVYVGYQTGTLTMIDCDSTGCTVAGETAEKTGAFIGMVNGTATLTNCTTDLTIGACNRVGSTGTLTVN